MPVWIRADFDFGAPWVSFHVAHRQLVVDGLWPPEGVAADADVMCRYAEECVRHYRPRLHNFSVVRMHADLYRATLVFDVVHPSFARRTAVQGPAYERLELCPVCEGPMPLWLPGGGHADIATEYAAMRGGRAVAVCSRECLEKCEAPAPEPDPDPDPPAYRYR